MFVGYVINPDRQEKIFVAAAGRCEMPHIFGNFFSLFVHRAQRCVMSRAAGRFRALPTIVSAG
jgi:hypothetical protein